MATGLTVLSGTQRAQVGYQVIPAPSGYNYLAKCRRVWWSLMKIVFKRRTFIAQMVGIIVVQFYLWLGFLTVPTRYSAGPLLTINDSIAIAVGIACLIFASINISSLPYILLSVTSTISLLMVDFSFIYWSNGTTANFNVSLTRLDAIYFMLGTLTTAGTGNIVATSDAARGVQSLQMFLDLALVVFAIGLVIARFSSSPPHSQPTTNDDQELSRTMLDYIISWPPGTIRCCM
jgi:Ion channel